MMNESPQHDPSPVPPRVAAEREQQLRHTLEAIQGEAAAFCEDYDGCERIRELAGIALGLLDALRGRVTSLADIDAAKLHADAAPPRSPQPEEKAAREQLLRSAPWEDDDLPMAERLMRAAEYVVQFDGCWFGHTDCIFLTELLREAAEAASPRAPQVETMSGHWMPLDEAIERLERDREGARGAAEVTHPDWLFDNLPPDHPMRPSAFDQNCVFASAADVVAYDLAIAALRREAASPRAAQPEGEWQCRFVHQPTGGCCQLPIGHAGWHHVAIADESQHEQRTV